MLSIRGITEESQATKRKCNKGSTTEGVREERHSESDKKNSILVRAYSRRDDDTHIRKAEIKIGSTGDLAVEHVAEKLKLKGILHVS